MSRTRRSFTTEYKVEAAHRVIDSGRTIAEVSRELGVNEGLLGRWVAEERRRVEAASARNEEPLTPAERTELARLRKQVAEQEKDITFLKKASVLCRQPTEVDRFELMAAECATTEITRMARLLAVSTSGYYKRAKRSVTPELTDGQQRKADLTVKIIDHHRNSGGVYGSPRITADLRAAGERVSEKTVAKIMSEIGLAGISPRTFKVRTTIVDPTASFPADLVERQFDQGRPDAVWSSDITYLTCGEGDMYLCAVRDEHSKRVLGWSVADHMLTELVTDALAQAVAVRGGHVGGTIMHSDRGTQYTARAMAQACADAGLRRSMGATGICWDNSGAESLWSTFKHEYYYRHVFATKAELVAAVDKWMHFYNNQRRHSVIGMLSPIAYEQSLNAAPQAA